MIAEMIQDRLEDYIDIYVGNAKRIAPVFLVEERFDYLIIGDVISKTIPSSETQDWLLKYREIAKNNNLVVKTVSGFYVAPSDVITEPFWGDYLQENINAEMIYPPILSLKLDKARLELEKGALELVKAFSNDFIVFYLRNK